MYTAHYESRQEKTSLDHDRADDTYGTLASTTTYRSTMGPRVTNFQRSRPTGLGAAGVSTRIHQSYQTTGSSGNFGSGLSGVAYSSGATLRGSSIGFDTTVGAINTRRQRDKRDLVTLNDKFAQYVEKVRFLEAHNRKLALELDLLRRRSGQGTSRIKEMYDVEMVEANKLIDDTKQDAAAAHMKAQQVEQELRRQRTRYNDISGLRETDRKEIDAIQQQIAENEAQIALFRRRIGDLEDETRRYKAETQRIASEIARLQNEIQNELFLRSSCEVEKVALEDDLASLKHMHEVDLADLRSQSVSNDLDPSKFFRNELAEAIREIRNDYETANENQHNDLYKRYSLVVNEIVIQSQRPDANPSFNEQQRRQVDRIRTELVQAQNQNVHFRARIQDMNNQIAGLTKQINDIRDKGNLAHARSVRDIDEARRRLADLEQNYILVTTLKTSLEKEISTYRDLLESQDGLRGYVDRIVQQAEQQAIERGGSGGGGSISVSGGGGGGGGSGGSYLYGSRAAGSTTVSRTYINTTGSNYGYGGGTSTGASISNLINQSSTSPGLYQTLSNSYTSTTGDYKTRSVTNRDSLLRDGTNRESLLRDGTNRESLLRDNRAQGYTLRESSTYDTIVHDGASSVRNSLIRENTSSSRNSLLHDNTEDETRHSVEYDTFE